MTRAARLLSAWASTCSAPQATLYVYTQPHTCTHRNTHLSSCPNATSLRKALESQRAMSSLCQHILYPNINVTEYNQSSEQPGSAAQWKTACVTGVFPRLRDQFPSSAHGFSTRSNTGSVKNSPKLTNWNYVISWVCTKTKKSSLHYYYYYKHLWSKVFLCVAGGLLLGNLEELKEVTVPSHEMIRYKPKLLMFLCLRADVSLGQRHYDFGSSLRMFVNVISLKQF